MAYGNGNSSSLLRMIPLGTGAVTATKQAALATLRQAHRDVCNDMAAVVFEDEPLNSCRGSDEIAGALYEWQKHSRPGVNVVYVEKARLAVAAHVHECHSRYFRRLAGWLAGCDHEIEYAPWRRARAALRGELLQRWSNIPPEIQATLPEAEIQAAFAGIKAFCAEHDRDAVLDLIRQVAVKRRDAVSSLVLSPLQIAIVREVHRRVRERWKQPSYGEDDRYVAQIHLDYRIVRGQRRALDCVLDSLDAQAQLLLDAGNGKYTAFLEISNPTPRGDAIRLPLCLRANTLRRLFGAEEKAANENTPAGDLGKSEYSQISALAVPEMNSLVLEIGPEGFAVKAVVARRDPLPDAVKKVEVTVQPRRGKDDTIPPPRTEQRSVPDWEEIARRLNACDHLIGRDFGYTNTAALSVVRRTREITASDVSAG